MNEQPGERRADNSKLVIHTPGGLRISAHGRDLILVLLVLLAFVSSSYLIYQHAKESLEHDNILAANQIAIQQTLTEMIYVTQRCSLSREECQKLNMEMPESLRKKLKREDR